MEDFDKLIKKLEDMADPHQYQEGLTKAGLLVEAEARKKVAVNTGELRRSIESRVEDKEAIIGTPLEYAPYIEYGTGIFAEAGNGRGSPWSYQDDAGNWHTTVGQPPQPFLRPALEEKRQEILEVFSASIKEAMKK